MASVAVAARDATPVRRRGHLERAQRVEVVVASLDKPVFQVRCDVETVASTVYVYLFFRRSTIRAFAVPFRQATFVKHVFAHVHLIAFANVD